MRLGIGVAALAIALASGCSAPGAPSVAASTALAGKDGFSAEIRRTVYGDPHIKANDMGGIGYGFGYASAEDNICEILDRMLTVSATRALYLGPGEKNANVDSDIYHQRLIQLRGTERLLDGPPGSIDTPSPEARRLAKGYVAGVNRYLRETGALEASGGGITDPRCKGAPWVHEITELDFWRHMYAGQTVDAFFTPVANAAPPGAQGASLAPNTVVADIGFGDSDLGSNAYGLGREVTKGGKGMLLGNPHYPWDGPNRFYRTHFIIPGKLNVVGVSYVGMPLIRMGHTDKVAWSNTVSTARRYGYYELQLDPANPKAYMHNGMSVPMQEQTIAIRVKGAPSVIRTLYSTRFGPVVESETFPWTAARAFALRTVEVGLRDADQYMSVWQSANVRDMRDRLTKYQSYRFNTTATDAGGETFFGDAGMIPNVTPALAEKCSVSDLAKEQWKKNRMPVLDGSRAECEWGTDRDSTQPGVFGPSNSPYLFRTDYVTQSNDSYWLTNPKQPITGLSPIWGDEATARSLRTRLGLDQVARRVTGADQIDGKKFDLKSLQQTMYGNRHMGGEMARDDLVKLCWQSEKPKMPAACRALAGWDLKVDLDSRGAHLFHLFAENGGLKWKVPFDPKNPVNTPNTLDTANPKVLEALEKAVDKLAELSIPLDAKLRDVQRETRGTERIAIHGGAGAEGVFNVITVDDDKLEKEFGWTKIRHGASWIMTVEFTDKGPVSQGILTYGESVNPNSAHRSDQTRLYSRKGWDDLRFTEAEVEGGTVSRKMISE